MKQYIDKSDLVAEIDRQKIGYNVDGRHSVEYDTTRKILNIINNLKVKEVNLTQEVERFAKECGYQSAATIDFQFAKHFFELGLSVNNPITASDRGKAEEIIFNLRRVEQDYCISLTEEIEWLRNKVKKGE